MFKRAYTKFESAMLKVGDSVCKTADKFEKRYVEEMKESGKAEPTDDNINSADNFNAVTSLKVTGSMLKTFGGR